jgi:bifunctional NMN adenylyltransferase/nudix hydrolase
MKTTAENVEVGVVVGRFQTPNLHEAHIELITRVINAHPRVLLFLGLAADSCKCTFNNPLDYSTRRAMIEQSFPSVEVHYIKDQRSDELWSRDLDRQIHGFIGPKQKVVLYGGRESFIKSYKGSFPTIELVPTKFISGKEIRKNVGIKSKPTPEFREGVIHAVENQWPTGLPCADIAVVDFDRERVLMGRKPGEDKLRFSGGYVSVEKDKSYEDTANREGREELKVEMDDIRYIGSTIVDDWRYRSERNKVFTSFFVSHYVYGSPQAADDFNECQWISYKDLENDELFMEEHLPLVKMLRDYLKRMLTPNKK